MRRLVTNTRQCQAYTIIRSLRPHAEWISATMNGTNWLTAHTATAALSRLVNRRHVVTNPIEDWAAGKIQRENTEREECYIRDIEKICRQDQIDTIFPSYDPQVYILAKNRQRLAALGIQVMAPEYETLLPLLDKSLTLKLAAEAGFPHPATFRIDEHDLADLAQRIEPPWVVRPTASSSSRGMEVIRRREDLEPIVARLQSRHRNLILQEYIPGTSKQNFYILIGRDNQVLSMVSPQVLRTSHRIYRNSSTAVLFNHTHAFNERVRDLVQKLNWHGGLTLQTKIDARDGTPKLMEINPRFGSHTWYNTEMGIDLPLMYLRSFRGEPVDPVKDYPDTALMLEPCEDFFGFFFHMADRGAYQIQRLLGKSPTDPAAVPASIFTKFKTLKRDYCGKHRKVYQPQFRYALSDPMVLLLNCWAVLRQELSQLKRIGI